MIQRWKHCSAKVHLLGILQGFAELMDGLVTVLSLGFLCSGFEMKVSFIRAKAQIKYLKGLPK